MMVVGGEEGTFAVTGPGHEVGALAGDSGEGIAVTPRVDKVKDETLDRPGGLARRTHRLEEPTRPYFDQGTLASSAR